MTATYFDQAIAYLAYTAILAGVLQVAINHLKPIFIDPFKPQLADNVYLAFMYVFRGVVTFLAYFGLWGGIEATRAAAPSLFANVPDGGVAFATIALVVLGAEFIHGAMDWLYNVKEGVGKLEIPLDSAKSVKVDAQMTPPVNTVDKSFRGY